MSDSRFLQCLKTKSNNLCQIWIITYKGQARVPKRMNFWKSSKVEVGSFSIRKYILQILEFKGDFYQDFWKECNIIFRKWGGGAKAVWNFSENSSVLVAWPVPQSFSFLTIWNFQGPLAAQYLHLQHQVVQSDRCFVQVGRPMDRHWEESSLQPGIINKTIKPWETLTPS